MKIENFILDNTPKAVYLSGKELLVLCEKHNIEAYIFTEKRNFLSKIFNPEKSNKIFLEIPRLDKKSSWWDFSKGNFILLWKKDRTRRDTISYKLTLFSQDEERVDKKALFNNAELKENFIGMETEVSVPTPEPIVWYPEGDTRDGVPSPRTPLFLSRAREIARGWEFGEAFFNQNEQLWFEVRFWTSDEGGNEYIYKSVFASSQEEADELEKNSSFTDIKKIAIGNGEIRYI